MRLISLSIYEQDRIIRSLDWRGISIQYLTPPLFLQFELNAGKQAPQKIVKGGKMLRMMVDSGRPIRTNCPA